MTEERPYGRHFAPRNEDEHTEALRGPEAASAPVEPKNRSKRPISLIASLPAFLLSVTSSQKTLIVRQGLLNRLSKISTKETLNLRVSVPLALPFLWCCSSSL